MLEKILLINYYWPPCGGPAVQRWLDITNFLAQKDIQTCVVTIDEKVATFPSVDNSLKSRVHPTVKVATTQTGELFSVYKRYIGKGKVPSTAMADEPNPNFLQKAARFARGNFFLPDPRIGWNKYAFEKACELIEQEGIKVFFTAGPPHSTHLVGLSLRKKYPGIRWIADFHDYWTDVAYLKLFYRTAIAAFFDRKLERRVLNTADMVMTHCNSSKELLSSRITKGSKEKVFVHTMGFNETLFPFRQPEEQPFFLVSYVGMITSAYKPGPFFSAVKKATELVPDVPFKLRFVGAVDPAIKMLVEEAGIGPFVEEAGYLPHQEAILHLAKSSALLLVNPQSDKERIIVPGKLYEYLATFKPVISLSVRGSENEAILREWNAGQNFDRSDVEGMTAYIVRLMKEWKEKRNIDLPYNEGIYVKYGRKNEAFSLAGKIRALLH